MVGKEEEVVTSEGKKYSLEEEGTGKDSRLDIPEKKKLGTVTTAILRMALRNVAVEVRVGSGSEEKTERRARRAQGTWKSPRASGG